MPKMTFHKLLTLALVFLVCATFFVVKGLRPPPGRLPYQAPGRMPKRTRFGLTQLAPTPRTQRQLAKADAEAAQVLPPPSSPAAPSSPFHTVEGNQTPPTYLRVHVYKQQKVRTGSGITLQLEEEAYLAGQYFERGSLLHGLVRFGSDRVLITVHTVQPRTGEPMAVQLAAYETDYNLGLYVPGASEWEKPQEQLAEMAIGQTAGTIRELANLAKYTWKCLKTKQSVLLHDGRVLLVGPAL